MFKNEEGFNLLELVVAVGVAGIIAAVALPTFAGLQDKASQTSATYAASASAAEAQANALAGLGSSSNSSTSGSSSNGPVVRTLNSSMEVSGVYASGDIKLYQMMNAGSTVTIQSNSLQVTWDSVPAATMYKVLYIDPSNDSVYASTDVSSPLATLPDEFLSYILNNNVQSIYFNGIGASVTPKVQIIPYSDSSYGVPTTVSVSISAMQDYMKMILVETFMLSMGDIEALQMSGIYPVDIFYQPPYPWSSFNVARYPEPGIAFDPSLIPMLHNMGIYGYQNTLPMPGGSTHVMIPSNTFPIILDAKWSTW